MFRIEEGRIMPFSVVTVSDAITCEMSYLLADAEWDRFVSSTQGGSHLQSSLWAVFKANLGWSPVRIILRADHGIVAGAQVLYRQLPYGLKVGHVLQGPVLSNNDPIFIERIAGSLMNLIHSQKIHYFAVVPPRDCTSITGLQNWGFHISRVTGGERATLVLDLRSSWDKLQRGMRRTTRNNIWLAQRKGVRIREGSEADLSRFHELLQATGRRQKFTPESAQYYRDLWRCLAPSNKIRLFIAEHEGEMLSGLLTVPFADTVVAKVFGWSGTKRWLRPNELLYWKAIEWSKANDFLNFDFDAIEVAAALALLGGEPLPESLRVNPTRFKLGFGGSIILLPPAYEYLSNLAFRIAAKTWSSVLGSTKGADLFHRVFLRS